MRHRLCTVVVSRTISQCEYCQASGCYVAMVHNVLQAIAISLPDCHYFGNHTQWLCWGSWFSGIQGRSTSPTEQSNDYEDWST